MDDAGLPTLARYVGIDLKDRPTRHDKEVPG